MDKVDVVCFAVLGVQQTYGSGDPKAASGLVSGDFRRNKLDLIPQIPSLRYILDVPKLLHQHMACLGILLETKASFFQAI